MLSGKELFELRKTNLKSLPNMPPKGFIPTNSPEENSCINNMILERLSYYRDERVEKKNTVSRADWIPSDGLARVEQPLGGGWETFGFYKFSDCVLYLYPEEALFLVETAKVELYLEGTPLSVQHAYSLILQTKKICTLEKFRVYGHLKRQGYRILRHIHQTGNKRSLDTKPENPAKKARVEPIHKKFFQTRAAEVSDLNLIPDFGHSHQQIEIVFTDMSLIPKSLSNIQTKYVLNRRDFTFDSESRSWNQRIKINEEIKVTKPSSWAEFEVKKREWVDFGNTSTNPLFRGATKPLFSLSSIDTHNIYEGLHLFSKAKEVDPDDDNLQVAFDVYAPGLRFRKSNPGTPTYAVVITTWDSKFPSCSSLQRFRQQIAPQTLLIIAVTGQGSDISFYQPEVGVAPLLTL